MAFAAKRRRRTRLLLGLAVLCVALIALALNTLGQVNGFLVERVPPQRLSALIAPYYTLTKPPGDGPFPTALLYSGCDGPRDNMVLWAKALNDAGWAAIIVDSHTPRHLKRHGAWALVCFGQRLSGAERAGDVLVSIHDAQQMPFVDPKHLALIGMSHGGWAIMEVLTQASAGRLPLNLTAMPDGITRNSLDAIHNIIMIYPWCGIANTARWQDFALPSPLLIVLARGDFIAPSTECLGIADRLKSDGANVETMVYDDVTHGFDQQHGSLSLLEFDAAATADALARSLRFLGVR